MKPLLPLLLLLTFPAWAVTEKYNFSECLKSVSGRFIINTYEMSEVHDICDDRNGCVFHYNDIHAITIPKITNRNYKLIGKILYHELLHPLCGDYHQIARFGR